MGFKCNGFKGLYYKNGPKAIFCMVRQVVVSVIINILLFYGRIGIFEVMVQMCWMCES
jgi:hypothetical protein